jgi:hypothetical protein
VVLRITYPDLDRTYLQSPHRNSLYKETHQIPGPHPPRGQLLDAYGYRVYDISTQLSTSDTRREQAPAIFDPNQECPIGGTSWGKRTKKAPMATMSTFESLDEETSEGNYSDNDYHIWSDEVDRKSKKSRAA